MLQMIRGERFKNAQSYQWDQQYIFFMLEGINLRISEHMNRKAINMLTK